MDAQDRLYTLIPLTEFKAVLGIDDREDPLSRFVLITSTYTIEQYCKRRLLKRANLEYLDFWGDGVLPLREYPVRRIMGVYQTRKPAAPLSPELYYCIPECGAGEDIPGCLAVRPEAGLRRGERAVKVRYLAGYDAGKVPADLASACMELAAWNMSRYRGRRIGMTGAVRGKAAEGEHLESSMPENVRALLEPYRRHTI
ncbi:hypothetical protein AGMMS49928_22430 [Spirochaetia bacterium]|nr:hypothetical protein AGMMS49928_22430 [Spirochaetia bacterium]